jgi:hypothetical protein
MARNEAVVHKSWRREVCGGDSLRHARRQCRQPASGIRTRAFGSRPLFLVACSTTSAARTKISILTFLSDDGLLVGRVRRDVPRRWRTGTAYAQPRCRLHSTWLTPASSAARWRCSYSPRSSVSLPAVLAIWINVAVEPLRTFHDPAQGVGHPRKFVRVPG